MRRSNPVRRKLAESGRLLLTIIALGNLPLRTGPMKGRILIHSSRRFAEAEETIFSKIGIIIKRNRLVAPCK